MSIKKLLLLAGMALAAIAFAAPAASATVWKDAGTALPAGEQVHLTAEGTAEFSTFLGGVHCETSTIDFTIENKSGHAHGQGTAFTADESSGCHGSGNLEGCTVRAAELTTPPVTIEADPNSANDLIVTNVTLWSEFVQTPGSPVECGIEELELDFEGQEYLTAELDEPTSVEDITISAPNGGILTAFGLEVPGVEVEAHFTIEETCVATHPNSSQTHIATGCDGTYQNT